MQESNNSWSPLEEKVAQEAFNKAYDREVAALIKDAQAKADSITQLDDLWRLHDFLSARRHEIDGKYDYRPSALLFIFANLIKDGWLHLDELESLDRSKLAKIAALSRM